MPASSAVASSPSLPLLLMIGCGNMGSAMLRACLEQGVCDVAVVDPKTDPASVFLPGLPGTLRAVHPDLASFFAAEEGAHDYALYGVKPQDLDATLRDYAARARKAGGIRPALSVAAGAGTSFFKERLGADAQVVRAMPNIAARAGAGAGAVYTAPECTQATAAFARSVFAAAGCGLQVENEALLHAVTAISGSGPAYFFYLAECMQQAGAAAGLSPESAARLAAETLAGAGALATEALNQGMSLSLLRRQVTSPGGVTAAALAVFGASQGLAALTEEAVRSAVARSKELALP